jgi:exopolyphosphatase/guanosine-5'-triphosphate,3'-diphosphate pyrophosphatase
VAKFAIIDVGSRSVVLEVFEVRGDSCKTLYYASEATYLGRKLGRDGVLNEASMSRTLDVLSDFRDVCQMHGNCDIHAICTAAVRIAKNGEDFAEAAYKALSEKRENEDGERTAPQVNIKIISGKKEAYYEYLGIVNTTAMSDFVIIDVGGASTEISLVRDRKLEGAVSFSFGAVSLTERFFPHEHAAQHNISEAENTILQQINEIEWLARAKGLPIIGAGSCLRNLMQAEMNKRLATCSSLHNYMINYSNFKFMYKHIGRMTPKMREEKIGIPLNTAEVILGGLVPLQALFKAISARRVYYSEHSLRQGVFYEKFAQMTHKITPVEADVLGASVSGLQERFNCDAEHAGAVEEIADTIFRQTYILHHMGDKYKRILSVAAKLHDCGEYIAYHNHHEHSFYLIKESAIYGLEQWDKLNAAIVAGMHRHARLKFKRWQYRRVVNANTYKRLRILAAILAISTRVATRRGKGFADEKDAVKCQISQTTLQVIISNRAESPSNGAVRFERKIFGRNVFIA